MNEKCPIAAINVHTSHCILSNVLRLEDERKPEDVFKKYIFKQHINKEIHGPNIEVLIFR